MHPTYVFALLAPLLLASCCGDPRGPTAVAAPVSEITMPDLMKDQDLNASIRATLAGGFRATFTRIEPFRAEDGDLVAGPLLGFEGRFYRVLGPETDLAGPATKIVRADIEAALRHSDEVTLFCGFSPGLFVRLRHSVGGEDILIGMGAICLQCGEWHLQLRSDDDEGYGTLIAPLAPNAYDDVVDAALATFPADGALKKIRKPAP